MFEKVLKWKLKPTLWVWVEDGSSDDTAFVIQKCINKYKSELNVDCVYMPRKEKGNLATLGLVYNHVFKVLDLRSKSFDFMGYIDVDTEVTEAFYYNINEVFKRYYFLGVVSGWNPDGIITSEALTGSSLNVRWEIVKRIEKFWDMALDSFLIIKSEQYGYKNKCISERWGHLKAPKRSGYISIKGAIWNGRAWAYVGSSWWSAFRLFLFRLVNRWNAFSFLRGYIWNRNWRCDDQDILDYYNRPFNVFTINKKLFQQFFRKLTRRSDNNGSST